MGPPPHAPLAVVAILMLLRCAMEETGPRCLPRIEVSSLRRAVARPVAIANLGGDVVISYSS